MRVFVADDHSLFRDGLVSLLDAAGFTVIGQTGSGAAAVEDVLRLRPDVTLLDLNMPELNGLEALRLIRAQWPEAKVVLLTVSDDEADLLAAVEAGAAGYLLKNLKADEFLEILKGVEHQEAAMTRQTTARLLRSLAHAPRRAVEWMESLTPREKEMLELLAAGLSNKAIAQKLAMSENTVKYHVKNILQKMGVHNRTEATAQAMRTGLLKPKAEL